MLRYLLRLRQKPHGQSAGPDSSPARFEQVRVGTEARLAAWHWRLRAFGAGAGLDRTPFLLPIGNPRHRNRLEMHLLMPIETDREVAFFSPTYVYHISGLCIGPGRCASDHPARCGQSSGYSGAEVRRGTSQT
jgi:hypothetical protein